MVAGEKPKWWSVRKKRKKKREMGGGGGIYFFLTLHHFGFSPSTSFPFCQISSPTPVPSCPSATGKSMKWGEEGVFILFPVAEGQEGTGVGDEI
jgi:hypothetical protein